ncbi:transketolase family protein [Phaeacidiphilus oryzae]|uniref:transketolase family protein n=1 Tax=Phaeacidiphilus oryzae TaxID=348818 RepID=UPI00055AAA99|nr:transketolase C-terminal domain-containing protein [Phaeacidiphilus oryzae]
MGAMQEHTVAALVRLAEADPRVVVITADLCQVLGLEPFRDRFPDRFFNLGIAEQNMMATAAGLALDGYVPYIATFAMYATLRAGDQLRNGVALQNAKVRVIGSHCGISAGENGASHQSLEDLAVARAIPNMTVLSPAGGPEAGALIEQSLDWPGPVYVRLAKPSEAYGFGEEYRPRIGAASVVREGTDAAILSTGFLLDRAMAAAEALESEGLDTAVLNVHTVKPLDERAVLDAARSTGALVTVEDHSVVGGLGGAVCELVATRAPVPVERVGVGDTFGESGDYASLLAKYRLDVPDIASAVRTAVKRKEG